MTRNTRSRARRTAVIVAGPNAAAELRTRIRADFSKDGKRAVCVTCLGAFVPSLVDVDHIEPIHKGGEDVPGNVQVLCKGCHKVKTHQDCGYTTPLF